jgi:PAS domain S-box-containing protein
MDQSLPAEILALQKENQELKDNFKNYQVNLSESQVRFKTVFESSLLGNKIISSDLKIIEVNQALVALMGYDSKEDLIGYQITDFAPLEFQDDWKSYQDKLWSKSMPYISLETCLTKKDGTFFWCQVTSVLFKDRGETFGFTVIEDCTERHNLRRQKEEFISVASHELRTPITSLKARLQIINRTLSIERTVTPELIKMSLEAEKYTSKLGHLVGDLLNLTQLEHESFPLNKVRFVLSEVVNGCCSHIALLGDYHVVYKGDIDLEVTADLLKIDQILIHLVNNAVKYSRHSKKIIVEASKIGNYVKVSVIDQGEGISPEHIAKLFTRYYRADKDFYNTSGLGLGLYVSSEIIKRHGGEMGVESKLGEGSTFWFTLPNE